MNFRKFVTASGTTILAGRTAENNEELIKQAKKNENVFHTSAPGSPFVNIKGKPKRGDIKTAAVFCARYSREWKKKRDVEVHRFKGRDIFKRKEMKTGTFGVKKFKRIKVKKRDIIKFENETTGTNPNRKKQNK
jgi:predicted ribosome quality control (RQC) complex YloA/Tae2 family protein